MVTTEVHIAHGPSAGGCLKQALGVPRDMVLINHDLLSSGPLPPLDSLDDWRDVRQAYLNSFDDDWPTFVFAEQHRDLLSNPESLQAADTITLWIGTGLAEQLLLIWVVAFLHRLGIDPAKLRVAQFERIDKHEVISVGMLDPSRLREHSSPSRLDAPAIREAVAAWEAVTAPEPDALLAFLNARDHALPFLQRGLSALLYRYPDVVTGLNAWEYLLLRYAREAGPKAVRVVGNTLAHEMEFPDWADDRYLFQRLGRLAAPSLSRPLLALSGTDTLRETKVRITPHGEDVLAGKANAVEWNGVDDWIGGVHLDSQNKRVWFRKDRTLVRGV